MGRAVLLGRLGRQGAGAAETFDQEQSRLVFGVAKLAVGQLAEGLALT